MTKSGVSARRAVDDNQLRLMLLLYVMRAELDGLILSIETRELADTRAQRSASMLARRWANALGRVEPTIH